jgi:hypothetical protein
MTPNIDKFVKEVSNRLSANNGKIPAPLYFEIGKLCGMTCKQVVEAKKEHFADKVKGGTRTTSKPVKAAKKAVKKAKPAKKEPKGKKKVEAEPAALTKKQKKALANADESTGIVEDTDTAFVWIASPEEIASTEELHKTNY